MADLIGHLLSSPVGAGDDYFVGIVSFWPALS